MSTGKDQSSTKDPAVLPVGKISSLGVLLEKIAKARTDQDRVEAQTEYIKLLHLYLSGGGK